MIRLLRRRPCLSDLPGQERPFCDSNALSYGGGNSSVTAAVRSHEGAAFVFQFGGLAAPRACAISPM